VSEPEAEQEDKPVENEENGEPDEEVKHFYPLSLYILCLQQLWLVVFVLGFGLNIEGHVLGFGCGLVAQVLVGLNFDGQVLAFGCGLVAQVFGLILHLDGYVLGFGHGFVGQVIVQIQLCH